MRKSVFICHTQTDLKEPEFQKITSQLQLQAISITKGTVVKRKHKRRDIQAKTEHLHPEFTS